ncbi:MAG: 6-carboxytetrahydropterin synthase [Rickettsiales bacterium]|nr:MAG: 6-carboxytetrahydropterin synthase [Rickettsiales bacterium]
MIAVTVKIEFDTAHRVVGHQNKCKFLHGHRFVLKLTAKSSELNELGMVADFAELKQIMKEWIDDNFDHTVILYDKDKKLGDSISDCTGQKIYYLAANPTAENIALHLKKDIIPILFNKKPFEIIKVKLYETPNAFVEVY